MGRGAALRVALILALAACSPPALVPGPRDGQDAFESARVVHSWCTDGYQERHNIGTVVILDATHAITAAHVTECGASFARVRVGDANDIAWVESEDRVLDQAVLVSGTAVGFEVDPDMPAAKTAHLRVGEAACVHSAWPVLRAHCGVVSVGPRNRWQIPGASARGTSGAGVYQDGYLVGIAVGSTPDATTFTAVRE